MCSSSKQGLRALSMVLPTCHLFAVCVCLKIPATTEIVLLPHRPHRILPTVRCHLFEWAAAMNRVQHLEAQVVRLVSKGTAARTCVHAARGKLTLCYACVGRWSYFFKSPVAAAAHLQHNPVAAATHFVVLAGLSTSQQDRHQWSACPLSNIAACIETRHHP